MSTKQSFGHSVPPVGQLLNQAKLLFLLPIVSLAGLSLFPHQEPRFLIPLTVPLVLMNAHKLRWKFGEGIVCRVLDLQHL